MPPGSNVVARLGDRYCIAPEMEQNPAGAGPAADVYSLGIILYELLTGQVPTSTEKPPSSVMPGLPQIIDEVIGRCLQAAPQARYGSAREVKAAFYAALLATKLGWLPGWSFN